MQLLLTRTRQNCLFCILCWLTRCLNAHLNYPSLFTSTHPCSPQPTPVHLNPLLFTSTHPCPPQPTPIHLNPPLFASTIHPCTPQPSPPVDTHQPPIPVHFNHPPLLMLFVSENCRMINFVAKRTASWAQMCGVVALMYSGKLLVRYNKLLIITNLHYKTVIFWSSITNIFL